MSVLGGVAEKHLKMLTHMAIGRLVEQSMGYENRLGWVQTVEIPDSPQPVLVGVEVPAQLSEVLQGNLLERSWARPVFAGASDHQRSASRLAGDLMHLRSNLPILR